MKYSLRSLMIVVAIAPPLLAVTAVAVWSAVQHFQAGPTSDEKRPIAGSYIPGQVRPLPESFAPAMDPSAESAPAP